MGNISFTSAAASAATVLNPFSQNILAVLLLINDTWANASKSDLAPSVG
jgi:hypothetical protein